MSFASLLVTGATGLLGSNICQEAIRQRRFVRGLVRREEDATILRSAGIEPAIGDITNRDSLISACTGVDAVIHSAALLGGTWSKTAKSDFERVNYKGTMLVLDAARAAKARHVLIVGSLAMFDMSQTITEDSLLAAIDREGSPYILTKLAAYYAAMHRACFDENISYIFPGAMYGPSLFLARALEPTCFTGTLQRAILGQISEYARFPLTWPYAEDVARTSLAALDKQEVGGRYLAAGTVEDIRSLAEFCNAGCMAAGVEHRVRDLLPDELRSDIGPMKSMTRIHFASPLIDPRKTTTALGVRYTSLSAGVEATVAWLKRNNAI
jgi:nucleoside-diphosphate-sugar epimerase